MALLLPILSLKYCRCTRSQSADFASTQVVFVPGEESVGVLELSFCGAQCHLALMKWLMGFAEVACRQIQVMINSKQSMYNQTKGDERSGEGK